MPDALVFLLVFGIASFGFWLARRRPHGKWSGRVAARLASVCLLVAMLAVPEGPVQWALIALAAASLVSALATIPWAAWKRQPHLVALLVCVVAAIWAAEIFDLNGRTTTWLVAITGGLFVAYALFIAVRVIVMARRNAGVNGGPGSRQ